MFSKMVCVVLIAVLLHGSLIAQTQPQSSVQTPAMMQQVLRKAQVKDKAVKVKLARKIDDQAKLVGKVSEISDTGFTLTDQKTGATKRLAYEDIQQVSQKGLSKTAKILIISGVVVGTAIGMGFALACSSEGGPHC